MVQDVSRLVLVPPAQRLDGDTELFEGRHGLLDLNLHAAVRQHGRDVTVKEDFHPGRVSHNRVVRDRAEAPHPDPASVLVQVVHVRPGG